MIGALTCIVNAGDWSGKAPIDDKNPKAPIGCPDTNGEVTVGYMTDYLLHGFRMDRDTVWLDVNYTFDGIVPVTIGVTHFDGINGFATGPLFGTLVQGLGSIDETDVYAAVALPDVGGFSASLTYTHRFLNPSFPFPTSRNGSFGELSLQLRRDIGFADLILGTAYGINSSAAFGTGGGGWYHNAGLEKAIGITDSVSLVLGAGVGYHDGYFYNNSGWSNYYLSAALPIQLNCSATLTPYLGYNGVQQWDQYDFQGDVLHAGVSLTVSF